MSTWWFLVVIIPSIVLHEVSHGFVANLCGDPTAKQAGRLTLNPLSHVDPFGTVILPLILVFSGFPPFGWAKPVPVTISRLRNPRKQNVYVSLAGPMVNIVLSLIGLGLCRYAIHVNNSETLYLVGAYIGLPNLTLAIFNLLPIPPLDGSVLIERFVPTKKLGSYYAFRSRALPLVMAVVLLDNFYFHRLGSLFGLLEHWWLSLAA